MKKYIFIIGVFISACSAPNSKISVEDLADEISDPNVQILDVRDTASFNKGFIARSTNIDLAHPKFDSLVSKFYSSLPVYIVAANEEQGATAVTRMNILGYRQAQYLEKGIGAWQSAGNSLETFKPKRIYESDTIPFTEARKGSKLVMVDFNAEWCKPCKMLEPAVKKAHDELADDVIVYSINIDEHKEYIQEYDASSIPLLVFIKNGVVLHRSLGLISEEELYSLINKYK